MKTTSSGDVSACCSACFATPGCVAFTFATDGSNACYLKDNVYADGATAKDRVSGYQSSRTTATRACFLPNHTSYLFCDTTKSIDDRVQVAPVDMSMRVRIYKSAQY